MPDNNDNDIIVSTFASPNAGVPGAANVTTPQAPKKVAVGIVRRSMIFDPASPYISTSVPAQTMRFREWLAHFGQDVDTSTPHGQAVAERRADEYIKRQQIHAWGDPYQDQSAET